MDWHEIWYRHSSPLRINCYDFADCLAFPLAPSAGTLVYGEVLAKLMNPLLTSAVIVFTAI